MIWALLIAILYSFISIYVDRLEAHGRPYVVVHFGLERDVLAYHGCAELFQVRSCFLFASPFSTPQYCILYSIFAEAWCGELIEKIIFVILLK